jgi:ABC-2 type transport system permease protein
MGAMIIKEFRELGRDRRTVAMLVVLPLLLLVIFGYAANFYVSTVKAAVVGARAEQVAARLPSFFEVTVTEPADTGSDAEALLGGQPGGCGVCDGGGADVGPRGWVEPVRGAGDGFVALTDLVPVGQDPAACN